MNLPLQYPVDTLLFGYGYWGKKIKQTLNTLGYEVIITDPKLGTKTLSTEDSDYAFVITPEETHYELVRSNLLQGRHVFVEKPLCLHTKEAVELTEIAREKNCNLFVDYTFLYDPVIKEIKKITNSSSMGGVVHIESKRHSVGTHKPNIQVTDDLAPHDIYLFRFLLENQIDKVSNNHKKNNQEARVVYSSSSGITWTAEYSWLRPNAHRELRITYQDGEVLWKRDSKGTVLKIKKANQWRDLEIPNTVITPLECAVRAFFDTCHQGPDIDTRFNQYIEDTAVLESIRNADSLVQL